MIARRCVRADRVHRPTAGQVVRVRVGGGTGQRFAQQKSPAIGVEVGLIVRPATIDVVHVEARGAEILQGIGIVLLLEAAGGIEGQIVVNELAEVGVNGGDAAFLVVRAVFRVMPIYRGEHLLGELAESGLGVPVSRAVVSGRQRAENAPERAFKEGRAAGQVGTTSASVGAGGNELLGTHVRGLSAVGWDDDPGKRSIGRRVNGRVRWKVKRRWRLIDDGEVYSCGRTAG